MHIDEGSFVARADRDGVMTYYRGNDAYGRTIAPKRVMPRANAQIF